MRGQGDDRRVTVGVMIVFVGLLLACIRMLSGSPALPGHQHSRGASEVPPAPPKVLSNEQLGVASSRTAFASKVSDSRLGSATLTLASYDKSLAQRDTSKASFNRSAFISDVCADVDALIEAEGLTAGQARLSDAAAKLNEAQENFRADKVSEGAAKLVAVMDGFPGTEASKVSNRAISALQELAQKGQFTAAEVEEFAALLPSWTECRSAEGKYILLDFARTRADAAKALGQKAGKQAYNTETRAAAWQLMLEYPDSPIQIDVPVLYYESSAKLSPEVARGAAEDLAAFIEQQPESIARWASRSVLAMHLHRAAHDLESARIQQAEFLKESEKPFVQDVLNDDAVYDWVKALIEYEIGKAMFNLGRRQQAIQQFEGIVSKYPDGGWPTMLSAYMSAFVTDQDNYEEPEKGIAALSTFLEQYPDSAYAPKAMWNLASIYFRESDYRNAAALFQEVSKRWPGTNEAVASEDTINYLVTYNYLPSQLVTRREKGRQPTDLIRTAQLCGPTALQKLLGHRGVTVTVQELAALARTDGSGTSMLGLVEAAKRKGTDLIGVEAESVRSLATPFIAFVNGNHFVTVVTVEEDSVTVEDMNEPQSNVPMAEFMAKWNHKALVIKETLEHPGSMRVAEMRDIRGGSDPDPPADPAEGGLPTACPNNCDPGKCDQQIFGLSYGPGGAGFPSGLPKIDLFSDTFLGGDLSDAIRYATLPTPKTPGSPPSLVSPKASSTAGVDIPGIHLRILGYQGAVTLHETDIDVPVRGSLRLAFQRDYRNSWGFHRGGLSVQDRPWKNMIGASWSHNYHVNLQVSEAEETNGAPSSLMFRDDASNIVSFVYVGRIGTADFYGFEGDVVTWARGSLFTRDSTTGKLAFWAPTGLSYGFYAPVEGATGNFFARPEFVQDTSGNRLTYEYDGSDLATARLIKIHAPSGDDRYLQFNYGTNGLFETVQLKSDTTVLQTVSYTYTQDPATDWYELASVTDNGGGVVSYEYDTSPSPDPEAEEGAMVGRYMSKITDKQGNEYLITTEHKMHPTYGPQAYVITLTYPTGLQTIYDRSVTGTGHSDVTVLNTDTTTQTDLSKFKIVAGPHGYRPAKYVFYPTPGSSTGDEWVYEYDNMDLIEIKDPSDTTFAEYTYTGQGRLETATVAGEDAVTYTYPTGGSSLESLYPIQKTAGDVATYYEYDANLRLTQVYGPGAGAMSTVISTDVASAVGAAKLYVQRGASSDFRFDNFKRTSYPTVYVEDLSDGLSQGWTGTYSVTGGYMNLTGSAYRTLTDADTDIWFSYYLDTDGNTNPVIVHPRYNVTSGDRVQLMIYSGEMRLAETVSSVTTNLQINTDADTTLDTWYNVHIKSNGSNIEVYRGQRGQSLSLVLSTTSASVTMTGRFDAYVPAGDVIRLDNMLVTKAGTGTAAFSDNFDDGNYTGWTVGSGSWSAASRYLRSTPTTGTASISTNQVDPEGTLSFSYYCGDTSNPNAYGIIQFRCNATGADTLFLVVYPGKMELHQITAGTWIVIADNTSMTTEQGRWYDVEVSYRGYEITISRSTGYKLTYDAYGQVTAVSDGNGNAWAFAYDDNGNITSMTEPNNDETEFTYDEFGNALTETLNENDVAEYEYLDLSYPQHMSRKTYPDGATEEYLLNPQGILSEVINWDTSGNLTNYVYTHNQLHQPTANFVDSEVTSQVIYNRLGQIESQFTCPNGGGTTFAYDHQGRLTERTHDDGHEEHFTYSDTGALLEVRDENNDVITGPPNPYNVIACGSSAKALVNATSASLLAVGGDNGDTEESSCSPKACDCGCKNGEECTCKCECCGDSGSGPTDTDGDGIPDGSDPDDDNDGEDDSTDPDDDDDGIPDDQDDDDDNDGETDDTDPDDDGDGNPDDEDEDDDGDGIPDGDDSDDHGDDGDTDGDGIPNEDDTDTDGDGIPDDTDSDDDGDGIPDDEDDDDGDDDGGEESEVPDEPNRDNDNEPVQGKAIEKQERNAEEEKIESSPETDPLNYFSGEFVLQETDLKIEGRGIDFAWTRTYRSIIPSSTWLGNNWDHSYNIYLRDNGDGTLALHNGAEARRDIYVPMGSGRYETLGFFGHLQLNPDDTYTLFFEDGMKWEFAELSSAYGLPSLHLGKITAMEDRNGNTMTFEYDAKSRIREIVDTMGRHINIGYSNNRIKNVICYGVDTPVREVRYTYYLSVESGGPKGDLRSVRSPLVTGPDGGQPIGKTRYYTYTEGSEDDDLNHNMLTVKDGAGHVYLKNEYATTTDPQDFEFDRVVRQVWGDVVANPTDDIIDITYVESPSAPQGHASLLPAVKAIINDRNGHVSEYYYDLFNRPILVREFTGSADPTSATTETENRPTSKLRASDPDYFDTAMTYGTNLLMSAITYPNGNTTIYTYDSGTTLKSGNLIAVAYATGITQTFEYLEGFGSRNMRDFVTRATDPNGNVKTHTYDANGNRIQTKQWDPSETSVLSQQDFTYTSSGQLRTITHPSNGTTRRVDQFDYNGIGYLYRITADVDGEALVTEFDRGYFGQINEKTDPFGNVTTYWVNQLDQVVRANSTVPDIDGTSHHYQTDVSYDDANRVDEVIVQEKNNPSDAVRTVYEYDILGNVVSETRYAGGYTLSGGPLGPASMTWHDPIVTTYEYDDNRNVTRVVSPEGNEVRLFYDERDFLYEQHVGYGTSDVQISRFTYDGNGNLSERIEGVGADQRVYAYDFNPIGRLLEETDPLGRTQTYTYDDNGNVLTVHSRDASSNIIGSTTKQYDELSREIESVFTNYDLSASPPSSLGTITTAQAYNPNSSIATATNANGHSLTYTYDTMSRRASAVDELGNEATFTYQSAGGLQKVTTSRTERSALAAASEPGFSDQTIVNETYFDNLKRMIKVIEKRAEGDFITKHYYDSRGNRIKTVDADNNESTYVYDGLDRQTESHLPEDVDLFQTWDDDSRLVEQKDGSENATSYTYDALGRVVVRTMADNTSHVFEYNALGEVIEETDANGTVVTFARDGIGRVYQKTVSAAPGVDGPSEPELFAYDALSNLVLAENDAALVQRKFDSLGNLLEETLTYKSDDEDFTSSTQYDAASNPTAITYPGGRTVTQTFDDLERLDTVTSNQGGTLASYDYIGAGGRVERRTNGNATWGDTHFDSRGRPQSTTHFTPDIGGNPVVIDARTYAWDALHNKTQRVDARDSGPETAFSYQYDGLSRMSQSTRQPLTGDAVVREYALDPVGNRNSVGITVGQGTPDVQDYSMQTPDSLVNEYSAAPFEVTRDYDPNGNFTIRDKDRISESSLDYDYRNLMVRTGRKLDEQAPPAPSAGIVAWHDDFSSGLSTSWDDGGGTSWNATGGHLATELAGTSASVYYNSTSDQDLGLWFRYADMDIPAQASVDYADVFVRVDNINYPAAKLGVRIYKDHVELIDEGGPSLLVGQSFETATEGAWYWMYIECTGQTVRVYRGTAQDEMVLVLSAGSETVPAPDGMEGYVGIWEPYQTNDYRFDDFTMVEQPQTDVVESSYVYDALGRRIEKTVGSATTRYVYHGARVIEEYDGANTLQASYVYGNYIDEVITVRLGSLDYYYHADDLYNVMALSNADGDVVERYEYGDYGEPEFYDADDQPLTGSALGNTILFTSQRYDSETGLYWCKTRYLESATGRFTTRDPIGIWGDPANLGNGYTYAANNPWSVLDPFGMCSEDKDKETGKGDRSLLAELNKALEMAKAAKDELTQANIDQLLDMLTAGYFGASPVEQAAALEALYPGITDLVQGFQTTGNLASLAAGVAGLIEALPSIVRSLPNLLDDAARAASSAWNGTKGWIDDLARSLGTGQNPASASYIDDAFRGGAGKPPTPTYPEGSFSISNWNGYPTNIPQPTGPFRLVNGDEYSAARRAADNFNRGMHRADPSLGGQPIHDIHPIKFGGNPVDPSNKFPIGPQEHSSVTSWWNKLQQQIEGF